MKQFLNTAQWIEKSKREYIINYLSAGDAFKDAIYNEMNNQELQMEFINFQFEKYNMHCNDFLDFMELAYSQNSFYSIPFEEVFNIKIEKYYLKIFFNTTSPEMEKVISDFVSTIFGFYSLKHLKPLNVEPFSFELTKNFWLVEFTPTFYEVTEDYITNTLSDIKKFGPIR